MSDHQTFRGWSAAYVLGALDKAERREFELHLSECSECRSEIADLAPIPGLLGRVELSDQPTAPDSIADRAVEKVRSEWEAVSRSRSRWRWIAVAASVIALSVLTVFLTAGDGAESRQLVVDSGQSTTGVIALTTRAWGTQIEISLDGLPKHDRYIAWAVSLDGEWEQAATWGPTPTASGRLVGASSIETGQLEAIVITAGDSDESIATAWVANP